MDKYEEHYRSRESRIHLQLPLAEQTALQNIVSLLAEQLPMPVAHLTFIEGDVQHIIQQVGTQLEKMPRATSFCHHTIQQPEPMIVPDASADDRFAQAPVVSGPPHVRFYAGCPIVSELGFAIGTLCVYDMVPRALTTSQTNLLSALARQVEAILLLVKEQQTAQQLIANYNVQEEAWRTRFQEDQRALKALQASILQEEIEGWPEANKQLALQWTEQLKGLTTRH